MFASIKNLFFGSTKSRDPFDMEQRTKALLIQTQRNRTAGRQVQQRAHRPAQSPIQKPTQKPTLRPSKASLTNLKADLF